MLYATAVLISSPNLDFGNCAECSLAEIIPVTMRS